MLSTLRKFESYRCFVYLMKMWDVADNSRNVISDKIDRLLVFNPKSNRYYLIVEVPVDRNVE